MIRSFGSFASVSFLSVPGRLTGPDHSNLGREGAAKDALVDVTGDFGVAFGAVEYSPSRGGIAYLNVVAGQQANRRGRGAGGGRAQQVSRVLMGQREHLRGLSTAAKVGVRPLFGQQPSELNTQNTGLRTQDAGLRRRKRGLGQAAGLYLSEIKK